MLTVSLTTRRRLAVGTGGVAVAHRRHGVGDRPHDGVADDVGEADLALPGARAVAVDDVAVDLEQLGRDVAEAGRRRHRQAALHVGGDRRRGALQDGRRARRRRRRAWSGAAGVGGRLAAAARRAWRAAARRRVRQDSASRPVAGSWATNVSRTSPEVVPRIGSAGAVGSGGAAPLPSAKNSRHDSLTESGSSAYCSYISRRARSWPRSHCLPTCVCHGAQGTWSSSSRPLDG